MAFFSCFVISLAILLLVSIGSSSAQLSSDRDPACPKLLRIIREGVRAELGSDSRMGASLLRLHFHDCFVNGCDGSVLLNDTRNFEGEQGAAPNKNSLRGFEAIDRIKNNILKGCPKAHVSCADILAFAARESVVLSGGPGWYLALGRKDSRKASKIVAEQNLPSPTSNANDLITKFSKFGFTTKDLVALSGAHTIGKARCTTYRSRLYNERNIIDHTYANIVKDKSNCSNLPSNGDGNNTAFLDYVSPNQFDNNYFKNLVALKGLLHSDQQLYEDKSTRRMVLGYQNSQNTFFNDFSHAMVKMSLLSPPKNTDGEIRVNCWKINT